MTEQRFQDCLYILMEAVSFGNHDDWDGEPIRQVRSFADLDVMTDNKGLVIKLANGSEFQLTIVKTRYND